MIDPCKRVCSCDAIGICYVQSLRLFNDVLVHCILSIAQHHKLFESSSGKVTISL